MSQSPAAFLRLRVERYSFAVLRRSGVELRRALRRSLIGVALGRAAILPLTAMCSILTLRVVTTSAGVTGFASVSLIAALPALIPLGDLGVGASITEAVARYKAGGANLSDLSAVVRSSYRVLIKAAAGGVVIVLTLEMFSDWSTLLGAGARNVDTRAISLALIIWMCSLPLALGQRVLLGADRRALYLVASGLAAPTTLLLALLGALLNQGTSYFVAMSTVGLLLSACVSTYLAVPLVSNGWRDGLGVLFGRGNRVRLRSTAGPMLVITIALPIAYQSDRLVLSHLSTGTQLAVYSAGAQFFAQILAVVSVTGQFLWPRFAAKRVTGGESAARAELMRVWRIAAIAGVVTACAFALSLNLGVRILTAGRLHVGSGVSLAFAATLLVHAVYYPLGMYLTTPIGLKFQAVSSVVMAVVNVALSLMLAGVMGAAGPILASAIAIAVCMLLPACVRVCGKRGCVSHAIV